MIRIEECEIAVVQHLIDMTQQSNVLHQRVLSLGVLRIADCLVDVPELCDVDGHRNNSDGALIEGDRLFVLALTGTDLSQPGECAIVSGMDGKCRQVCVARSLNPACLVRELP